MCVVSNIGDGYARGWLQRPPIQVPPGVGTGSAPAAGITIVQGVGRKEFDDLKAEVQALAELLRAAKDFDSVTGQPDCEQDEKVELIRRIADFVGVDLGDSLG